MRTAYTNFNDLGFGRDMHCLEDSKTGNVACYVTNYSKKATDRRFSVDRFVLQDPENADLAFAASRTDFIATVCMEYSPIDGSTDPTKVVKFYVFGQSPNNPDIGASVRVTSANLDNSQSPDPNTNKFVPHLCLVCHGGTFSSTSANQHASFIAFDLESFKYSKATGASQAEQESAFKAQNLMVLDTNPDPTWATTELIRGWYHLDSVPIDVQDPTFVPAGWSDLPAHVNLYNAVVKPGCRGCHSQQRSTLDPSISWNSFLQFQNNASQIQNLVCGSNKQMPHAYVTYLNFWRIGRPGPNALAQFLFDQHVGDICQ